MSSQGKENNNKTPNPHEFDMTQFVQKSFEEKEKFLKNFYEHPDIKSKTGETTKEFNEKTHEGHVMDDLGLKRMCCRRHILTHVDI